MAVVNIEVVYAESETRQEVCHLQVEVGTTLETAIDRSGILEKFPEIDLMNSKVGVFSKIKKLSDKVNEGDRIEIYRPLTIDPKEARRLREEKRKNDQKC